MSAYTNIKYATPEEFLSELERDLLKERDPMNRHQITLGYARLMELRELSIQADSVAWSVGVIDDLHINGGSRDSLDPDQIFKGIKNALRDRYKAIGGTDPAPS